MSDTTHTRRLFASELEVRLENALPGSNNPAAIRRGVKGLEKLTRTQQNLALHWIEAAAQSSYEIALNIALLAPAATSQLDESGFEGWVLGSLERKDKLDLEHALAYLSDIDGFIVRHRHAQATATFVEVERRTRIFLHAISGEHIDVKPDEWGWTDNATLFLPEELAALPNAENNRKLYKAMATILWAQTRYGTFIDNSINLDQVLQQFDDGERALRWLAALEAVRLEARLAADYPGLVAEIAELRGDWPPEMAAALPRLSRTDASIHDTVALLREFLAGDTDIPPMPHAGMIDPGLTMRRIRAQKRKDGKPRFGAKDEGIDESLEPFPAEFDDGEAVGQGQAIEQPPGDSPSPHSMGSAAGTRNEQVPMQPSRGLFPEPDFKYDEWDFRRGVYKEDWCHLYEVPVKPGDPGYVATVKYKYRAYIQQIRRQLEMIKGEDKMIPRQVDGDELDIDAVVESFMERKNGGESTDRVFRRRTRNDRSLAVMFMVDMSGSTKGWVNNAERESLILLCEALELLNDNYAIYGFSGWGRTRCEIYPVKKFGEMYDDQVRARIAGIEGKDFTRMGVAIRHLSKLLLEEQARHHLLVTISDGYPDDFGDEYRNQYGIEDTRRALQEAHEKGVRSFCVTIDRQGADYLERLYGPARYEVVANAYKLPMRMAEIYRHLTS